MIRFTIPGAPVGKGRPRATAINGKARMYTPAKTVSYEGRIATVAAAAMAGATPLAGGVVVCMRIVCEVPASWSKKKRTEALAHIIVPTTKPDIDNVEKAVFDALNAVAWRDDVQVVDVVKSKRYGEVPGVHVEIEPYEPPRMPLFGGLNDLAGQRMGAPA